MRSKWRWAQGSIQAVSQPRYLSNEYEGHAQTRLSGGDVRDRNAVIAAVRMENFVAESLPVQWGVSPRGWRIHYW